MCFKANVENEVPEKRERKRSNENAVLKHNNKGCIQALDHLLTSKNESYMNVQYEPWLAQFLLAFFQKNYICPNQQWPEFGITCFGEIHPIMFATYP